MTASSNPKPVKSAQRALQVLDLLAEHPAGLTFADVCGETGWPDSSTYNLLRTMVGTGHVDHEEPTRRYRIGVRAWQVGAAFTRGRDLATAADPYLTAASTALNETVQLAILDGLDNVYVAKVDADQHLQLVSRIGSRLPAYATGLGKVLLAALSSEELDERLQGVELQAFTQHTVTDVDELRRHLELVRKQGYATDTSEFTEGVFCVAVPVQDANGTVVAGMSASVPQARVDADGQLRASLLEVLAHQAARLSQLLGHRPTD